jgi:hypothetical protein
MVRVDELANGSLKLGHTPVRLLPRVEPFMSQDTPTRTLVGGR